MKRVLLIYNPKAGNGIIKNHLDEIIDAFEDHDMLLVPYRIGGTHSVDRIMTEQHMEEYCKIIAAGGDGTINLVVNSMIRYDIKTPLAIFPCGTANDLATHLEIPVDIDGMIKAALPDEYIPVDVGKAGSKYFVNVLAIGMLVDISQNTDPLVKNALGIGAYYLRSLAAMPFAHPHKLRIISEEKTLEEDVSVVLVMNGRAAGGFKEVAPLSEVGDGLLDVIVIRKLIPPTMLPALFSVMTGQHTKDKHFEYFRTGRLRIESVDNEEIRSDVDGERGDNLPLDIEILPGRLLLPKYTPEEHFGVLTNFYR